jgi:hypothetical protein
MTLPNYSRIKLISDAYVFQNAPRESIGYIVEIYPDSRYEVEFSDAKGTTTAQIVAHEDELELFPEEESDNAF